jgi:hypothetical protein
LVVIPTTFANLLAASAAKDILGFPRARYNYENVLKWQHIYLEVLEHEVYGKGLPQFKSPLPTMNVENDNSMIFIIFST